MKRLAPWLPVAAAFLAAFLLRYGLVEPEDHGFRCASGGPWWCGPREAVIVAFHSRAIGALALVAGAAAFALRHRGLATGAAVLGALGLVLYNYDLSAVGFTLAALVLARRDDASTGSA